MTEASTPEPLPYGGTIKELRRTLVESSRHWADENRSIRNANRDQTHDPERALAIADASTLMAMSYSYVLAAILGLAEKEFGEEVATALAAEADDILTNGDSADHNADLRADGAS